MKRGDFVTFKGYARNNPTGKHKPRLTVGTKYQIIEALGVHDRYIKIKNNTGEVGVYPVKNFELVAE